MSTPPLLEPHETSIVDSGCTGHFLLVNAPCLNKVKSQTPLTVCLPNGATMESSHTAELNIPELNAAASIAHVFPGMANHSLLSVGQLCNEGYIVTFKNSSVTICNPQEFQILSGARDLNTGLWRINLRTDKQQLQHSVANNVYELRNTGALVHYLHKALFSPTKSALLQAVKNGHLVTWPGLTEEAINIHLKLTPATAMGHMNKRLQNIRSTSKTPITAAIDDVPETNTDLGTKTHLVCVVLVDQGQLYTDLTGKFPVRSSKGNSYVMVYYVYDCNYVKVFPMKSRSASEWVKTYDHIHRELTAKGFKPKLQTLDNEASAALKHFFTTNDVEYQLVPPHCHRQNAAERAIRRTLCGRSLLHGSEIPIIFVGQTFTSGGNHFESLADLETAPTVVRSGSLSWPRGLQQDIICTARMQNHCTQENSKATNLGTPRTTWIFLGPSNVSLPLSKCLHLGRG
jgi:hypothetical protein